MSEILFLASLNLRSKLFFKMLNIYDFHRVKDRPRKEFL